MLDGANEFNEFGENRDPAPPQPASAFSWKRVFLLLGFLVLMALPKAFRDYVEHQQKQAREQRVKQQELERKTNEMVQAAREGKVKVGPAFQKLFQIEQPANAEPAKQ